MLKDIVTSRTILNGVSQNDLKTWERFVKVYNEPMCEFARSQASLYGLPEHEAEDVVFTLFERFAAGKENFDKEKGSLRNWMMMRLKNIILDTARQRASARERIDKIKMDGASGESERQRDWKEAQLAVMRRALKVVLEESDPRTREVFVRVALEGGDPTAVGAEFGLSTNAIYQIKNRVITRLKRMTEEDPIHD